MQNHWERNRFCPLNSCELQREIEDSGFYIIYINIYIFYYYFYILNNNNNNNNNNDNKCDRNKSINRILWGPQWVVRYLIDVDFRGEYIRHVFEIGIQYI